MKNNKKQHYLPKDTEPTTSRLGTCFTLQFASRIARNDLFERSKGVPI